MNHEHPLTQGHMGSPSCPLLVAARPTTRSCPQLSRTAAGLRRFGVDGRRWLSVTPIGVLGVQLVTGVVAGPVVVDRVARSVAPGSPLCEYRTHVLGPSSVGSRARGWHGAQ